MHPVTEELISANEWRDGEFAKLKANLSRVEEPLWSRLAIPMIYAHWEGFVVTSLKLLIGHLNRLELPASRVPTRLMVVSLGDAYRSLSGKQSFTQRTEFTDRFRELLCSTVRIKKKIDTKSNLRSDVLAEICSMYGFNFSKFSEHTADIDRLVTIRNSIAHGENSVVPTAENVARYINAVTRASDLFREEVENFLVAEAYLIEENS